MNHKKKTGQHMLCVLSRPMRQNLVPASHKTFLSVLAMFCKFLLHLVGKNLKEVEVQN